MGFLSSIPSAACRSDPSGHGKPIDIFLAASKDVLLWDEQGKKSLRSIYNLHSVFLKKRVKFSRKLPVYSQGVNVLAPHHQQEG